MQIFRPNRVSLQNFNGAITIQHFPTLTIKLLKSTCNPIEGTTIPPSDRLFLNNAQTIPPLLDSEIVWIGYFVSIVKLIG